MSSQLFKGSEIIALAKKDKPQKIVNTQTAKQALAAIKSKYNGQISPTAKYYHRGGGNWIKYSPTIDKRQTSSKVKTSKPANYSRTAHQYDVRGLDTKKAGTGALKTRKIAKDVFRKAGTSVYMRPSPFTKEQVRAFNQYSHFEIDINKDFNAAVASGEAGARSKFGTNMPENVKKAIEYYRKSTYEYYLESGRARAVAPPTSVVGPSKYRGRPDRAHKIMGNAIEKQNYAKKRLDIEINKALAEKEKKSSGILDKFKVGDSVIAYWTNSNKRYRAKAKVAKVNLRTIVITITEPPAGTGYKAGQSFPIPYPGTTLNRVEKL